MLWRVLLVLLAALCLTPGAEAVKARRPQVYAASHYVTQGNGGPFTFVASASGGSDPSGTTVSTSSTLAVQTGDLLITLVSFEDGNGAETVSVTDNGNLNPHTITAGDAAYETTNLTSVYPFYRLSGVTNPTATFTASINASRAFKRIIVMQYRPPTGAVVSKDITGTRKATGNGTAIATGIFSTQGTYGVVCAMEAIYTSGTHSNSTIAGVSAENTLQQNGAYQWCRLNSGPITDSIASTLYSSSRQWVATAIAFESVGGTYVDTVAPADPSNLSGTIGDAQIALTWAHANIADVNHFSLQYDCGGGYLTWSPAPTTVAATITGLANETACNIKVAAVDTAGNTSSYTTPVSFTPTATPIRSAGAPTNSLASGTASTTISLTTSKNATCKYSTTAGTAYGLMSNTFTGAGTTSHSATASGLSDGNTYHYYVRCDDGASHTNLDDYEITFSIFSAGSVAGVEQRCLDLGSSCVCSEQLNANESSTPSSYWDPSDSTDYECSGSGSGLVGYSVVGFTSVAAFDMPGTGVSYVKAIVGGGGNDSIDGTHETFTTGTLCSRMYQRFSSDWPTAVGDSNQPVRQKMCELSGTVTGGGGFLALQCQWNPFVDRFKAETSSLGGLDQDLSWTGGTVTLQDCKDSWCRVEQCIDKLSNGNIRGRARAVVVDTGETATFLPSTYGSETREITVDRVWFGNLDRQFGSGNGTRYMTHAIETFTATADTTFWPGAACEVEGGC